MSESFVLTVKFVFEGDYSIIKQYNIIVPAGSTKEAEALKRKNTIQTTMTQPNKYGFIDLPITDFNTICFKPDKLIAIEFKHL